MDLSPHFATATIQDGTRDIALSVQLRVVPSANSSTRSAIQASVKLYKWWALQYFWLNASYVIYHVGYV